MLIRSCQEWTWWTAAAKQESKLGSRRVGNGAGVLARNPQIQLPKESMEAQFPPVGEGQKETNKQNFAVSEKFYYTECISLTRKGEAPGHQHLS